MLVTGNLRVRRTSALVPGDTALLSVTFPDPRIAALPSLSLPVISWLQSAFELMTEPRSAKSLTVSASSLSLAQVVYFSRSHDVRPPGVRRWSCFGTSLCLALNLPCPNRCGSTGDRGRAFGWRDLTNPHPFAYHEPLQKQQGRFPTLTAAGEA